MEVVAEVVTAEMLRETVQRYKDNGKRILAVSPSTLEKTTRTGKVYVATHFVVIAQ
jgi:hypothetical protein